MQPVPVLCHTRPGSHLHTLLYTPRAVFVHTSVRCMHTHAYASLSITHAPAKCSVPANDTEDSLGDSTRPLLDAFPW